MATTPAQAEEAVVQAREAFVFGANEMRLTARQWLTVCATVLAFVVAIPPIWRHVERFEVAADYRIPYALSDDYWLYQRRLDRLNTDRIAVVGDSVVWGEYVRPDGTLSHFLSGEAGAPGRFANCGVNGLFPLSLEGLMANYGAGLGARKVLLHCNLLWMTSPRADLSTDKEETFNHSSLVPQLLPALRCYRADANTRLAALASRSIPFCGWVGHLDAAYFNQSSIPRWTLAQDDSDPPRSPNAWRNPLAQITLRVPGEPAVDPLRGRTSPRHRPWNATGAPPTHFDWVPLDRSLQWQAFQRTVRMLVQRDARLFVVVGPFNEHMIAPEQRAQYAQMRSEVVAWLATQHVPAEAPTVLPSALYADASHPLTEGYDALARELWGDAAFQSWVRR